MHETRGERKREIYRMGDLWMDVGRRLVRLGPNLVHLTGMEFRLLRAEGDMVGHLDLEAAMCGERALGDPGAPKSFMHTLRRKLVAAGAGEGCIRSVYGEGYALEEEHLRLASPAALHSAPEEYV